MNRRVTLKDIARQAGVTPAAVSLALRNHPRISEATRARLQALAREMGYRQDALLSALSRHRSSPGKYSVIAWLNGHKKPEQSMAIQYVREVWGGAVARALALGLRIEEFRLHAPGMTVERLNNILRSRRIGGVLVAPLPPGQNAIGLNWAEFSAVALGHTLQQPVLHSIAPNQYQQMRLLLASVRALGYRRIGLYLDSRFDARCDNHWQAAFWVDYNRTPEPLRIPLLSYEGWGSHDPRALKAWVKTHRPEVVVIGGNIEKDFGISGDTKVVYHTVFSSEPQRSGINENGALVGATAVDVLIGMLARGEAGVPAHPQRVLIEGFWQPGKLGPKEG